MVLLMAADKQYAVHLPGITKGACGTTVADLFVCFAGGSRATHPLAYILGQPGIIRRSNSPSDQWAACCKLCARPRLDGLGRAFLVNL